MESPMEENKATQQTASKRGGFRTMPFIISNEIFEKLANAGLHANMVLYLTGQYHSGKATANIIVLLWSSLSSFTPIIGAFLSDSRMGRFRVIAWATVIELLGLIVLWLTSILTKARPPLCQQQCIQPTTGQFLFLFSALVLMAIGAGGIRPCSLAFAADQIRDPENPKNERTMQSFFHWYYVSVGVSFLASLTVIVYIQVKAGWAMCFGVAVGLMLFSTIMFFLGSFLYIKVKPNKNLLSGFAQVIAVAWKNRHLALPPLNSDSWYFHKGSNLVQPTDRLRFLNKACIIKNREKDLDSNGMPIEQRTLCTVRQVEELKAIIKVLPIWSSGFMVALTISQQGFSVFQANIMDRHLTSNFEIPAASFPVFAILSLTLWVLIYDRFVVPIMTMFTQRKITVKQRMGIGIAICCIAKAVSTHVENRRRDTAIREGLMNNPNGVASMSAMWLVPQYSLTGLAEGFNAIGQLEFYYSQFPKSMSSVAVALLSLGFAMGNLVAAILVKIVKNATGRGGRVSWLSDNMNQGHYDYYYGVLTILSVVNLFYYIFCSWAYGSTQDIKAWDDEDDTKSELEMQIDTKLVERAKESETE